MMQKMVSLTDQNQVYIPIEMIRDWGEKKPKKLLVIKVDNEIRLKPVRDFWSLAGSMKSDVKLTDKQLRKARDMFEKNWARGL